jgi:hypothetical protein
MKTNAKFWIPIALLLIGCIVLAILYVLQLREGETLKAEGERSKQEADSLRSQTYINQEQLKSSSEDKANAIQTTRYNERIKSNDKNHRQTARRIGAADAAEKSRIFTDLLDAPADQDGISSDSTDF